MGIMGWGDRPGADFDNPYGEDDDKDNVPRPEAREEVPQKVPETILTPREKIQDLREQLSAAFFERRDVVDGSIAAALASEHVLLLGPPGTAKSALARALAGAFGGTYFEWLLTKFSTPEEVFGPISLRALEEDRHARLTTGKLPEAHFALIDEVFKASSAILNNLLAVMNERVFHNDGAPTPCPLITAFGASNELPEGRDLEAFCDRFLLRFNVGYLLQAQNFRAAVVAPEPRITAHLTLDDLRAAQAEVARVEVSDDLVEALVKARDDLRIEGIVASDRRWKRAVALAKASAWLAGEDRATPHDLTFLVDCLWREPKERPKITQILGKVADPAAAKVQEILEAARESMQKAQAIKKEKAPDDDAYTAQAHKSAKEFAQQKTKLEELRSQVGARSRGMVADAIREVQAMHAEVARSITEGLGVGTMRSV